MIEGLEPVALQELRALAALRTWLVEGQLDALKTLTPVRGELTAEHRGNVLAVDGDLTTIITLTCDRCLGQFNQQLRCRPSELIWLGRRHPPMNNPGFEDVSAMEGLMECLDPRGRFDPEQWVFEQLNLQLPVVNNCGSDCPGPPLPTTVSDDASSDSAPVDPRWQALRSLQHE